METGLLQKSGDVVLRVSKDDECHLYGCGFSLALSFSVCDFNYLNSQLFSRDQVAEKEHFRSLWRTKNTFASCENCKIDV